MRHRRKISILKRIGAMVLHPRRRKKSPPPLLKPGWEDDPFLKKHQLQHSRRDSIKNEKRS